MSDSDQLTSSDHGPSMTGQDSAAWNNWARAMAKAEARKAATVVADAVGNGFGKFSREVQAALERRDATIAQLEARVAELEDLATRP